MYVSPKNILLQLRVNLNHPWTRTVGAGRPQAAVLEAPPTSTRSRTTISVLFVVCSPPVCLNKGKKCLLAERPEACLVRGQGCPQHNPQPARLHRRFDARRLLARRGVAREHRDEGGKLGNAVSVRRRACRNRSTVKAPRTLVAIAGFHPKPSSRFVRSRALFGLFLLDNASSRGADETRLVGS